MADKQTNIEKKKSDQVATTERKRSQNVFVPPVDIYETDDQVVMIADIPGVDQKNVDITLENDVLTIEGSVDSKTPEGYELVWSEYGTGDYFRSFNLSDDIDQSKVDAKVTDGVLKITFAKAEPAKPKKIKVNVG